MAFKKTIEDDADAGMESVKGSKTWSPPAGENGAWKKTRVRILPARSDHPHNYFWNWYPIHGNLPGAGRGIICPAKDKDEECPACEVGNQLWNAGKKEQARKFFSSWRAAMNILVLNRDGSVPDGTFDEKGNLYPTAIKIYVPGKENLENLRALIKSEIDDKGLRDITDPETGRDVFIRRKGTDAKTTRYEISMAETVSALDADVLEALEADESLLHDLTKVFATVATERIAGFLEAPSRKALPSPHKDPFADDDDDDDDDDVVEGSFTVKEDEEDEDDEVVPAPSAVRRVSKVKKSSSSEKTDAARKRLNDRLEEDDDEDDEDDEDD